MLRMLAIPVVAWIFHHQDLENYRFWSALIFSLAFITDQIDGWIAKTFNTTTDFGKLMDPMADKLIVITGLVLLIEKSEISFWIGLALILRELAVNSLRGFATQQGMRLPSSMPARIKSYFEGIAIGLCMLGKDEAWLSVPWFGIGVICLYISLFLAYGTAFQYTLQVFGKKKA